MGPTALERALVVALAPEGIDKFGWGQLRANGLIGWAVAVAEAQRKGQPGPKPNTQPFGHLGDLDALREQLSRALG